jgi:hypothetical protein
MSLSCAEGSETRQVSVGAIVVWRFGLGDGESFLNTVEGWLANAQLHVLKVPQYILTENM